MREIKFKAFVKDKNKIFDVKSIDFAYKTITFEEENKPTDTMRMIDQVELLQYTGLKDKNGKEIYEGDIVFFCDSNHDEEDGGMEVIFEDGEFLITGTGISVDLHECYEYELEVIGNVYEK